MDVAQARVTLDRAGVSQRDVCFPGKHCASLRQGALVVRAADTGFEFISTEYGLEELLARTSNEDEVVKSLVSGE